MLLIIGLIPFGGGHGTSLFLIIPSAPFYFGLIILPLAALFASKPTKTSIRVFLIIMITHYIGAVIGSFEEINFHPENVRIIFKDLLIIIITWLGLYIAGNIFLRRLYLRNKKNQFLNTE